MDLSEVNYGVLRSLGWNPPLLGTPYSRFITTKGGEGPRTPGSRKWISV